jgi:hypothetical protein
MQCVHERPAQNERTMKKRTFLETKAQLMDIDGTQLKGEGLSIVLKPSVSDMSSVFSPQV